MSETIIRKIKAGEFSRKELENLYSNAEERGYDDIKSLAKESLKHIDSRFYSKQFIKPIKDKIKQIVEEIAESEGWANWEDNKVGNGIKVGGPRKNGEELAEYFFSYRNPLWKRASYFAVFQHDEESAIQYRVGVHNGDEVIVNTSEEAIELFRKAIEK